MVLRGFEVTKEPSGFESMWKTLGFEVHPCPLPPLPPLFPLLLIPSPPNPSLSLPPPPPPSFSTQPHSGVEAAAAAAAAAHTCSVSPLTQDPPSSDTPQSGAESAERRVLFFARRLRRAEAPQSGSSAERKLRRAEGTG